TVERIDTRPADESAISATRACRSNHAARRRRRTMCLYSSLTRHRLQPLYHQPIRSFRVESAVDHLQEFAFQRFGETQSSSRPTAGPLLAAEIGSKVAFSYSRRGPRCLSTRSFPPAAPMAQASAL